MRSPNDQAVDTAITAFFLLLILIVVIVLTLLLITELGLLYE